MKSKTNKSAAKKSNGSKSKTNGKAAPSALRKSKSAEMFAYIDEQLKAGKYTADQIGGHVEKKFHSLFHGKGKFDGKPSRFVSKRVYRIGARKIGTVKENKEGVLTATFKAAA